VRRFTVETIREDNGEVVTTRAMTADEVAERNQPGLFERAAMGGKSDDEDGDGAHDYAADEDEREGETVPPAEGPPTEPPDAALTEGSAIDDPAAMLEAAAPDPEATPSRKRRGGLSVVSDKRH
jgi:hypothetical protein